MKKLVASESILTVISAGITSHEPFPYDLIRESKSQASLTFHNDYKMDKPYKITLPRGVSSALPRLWSLGGVFLLPFFSFLFFFPPPHNLSFDVACVSIVLHLSLMQRRTLYW